MRLVSLRTGLPPWLGLLLVAACTKDVPSPAPSGEAVQPKASAAAVAAPVSSAAPSSSAPSPAGSAPSDTLEVVPPGSPIIALRPIELALYLNAPATPALTKDTEQKVHARFPAAKLLSKPEPSPPPSAVVFAPEMGDFELPTTAELATFARGLGAAQIETAAAAKGALLLGLMLDGDPKLGELRKAQDLALDLAQRTGGFIWDESSHELFSALSWKALRVDGWHGDTPDVRRQYTTRYYKTEGRGRAVTLGLGKLGLPDLVVDDVPVMQSAAVVALVAVVAQSLVEGAAVGSEGQLAIDVKSLRHPAARAAISAVAAASAPLKGSVTLAVVDPEEGDAENRLAEVRFDRYGPPAGASDADRQTAAVKAILGTVAEQMATRDGPDPELKAIAQRTQGRMAALSSAFQKGLPAGTRLYVKVPYANEGESFELRWMSVVEWKGPDIAGVLSNEPNGADARDLGEGVGVPQGWVADYVLRKSDGSQEGGDTLRLLAGRAGAKR